MHALHHSNLLRAMTVTVIAAVLAIVLTLVHATGLNDLASTPAPAGRAVTPPVPKVSASSAAWAQSPFTRLLSAPVAVRWASPRP